MYLPVELHCHTLHSDGDFSVKELQLAALEDKLVLIALTDHNTMSGTSELDSDICGYICGIEWTTYFGHMLVLGAREFVDWRDAVPDNIDEKISAVKAAGGTVGIAHPYQLGSPMCTGGRWEFNVRDFSNVDYIEIWHEEFSESNFENEMGLRFWTELLDKGFRIAATYGRDWHRPSTPGSHFGCTYLNFENGKIDGSEAVNAIKCGKTVVSSGAKLMFSVRSGNQDFDIGSVIPCGSAVFSFFVDLHARERNLKGKNIEYKTIRIVTNGGKIVFEAECSTAQAVIALKEGRWYRAELWGTENSRETLFAVTSPVYCE